MEGWFLAECRFRPLHTYTESALIIAAYYAALMLELQPIQINLNGGIKNHASKIPKWSSGCRAILLLQPSSAAAERVFSLLTKNNRPMH